MTSTLTTNVFDQLPRVGLAELNRQAQRMTRVDRKYVLPEQEFGRALGLLRDPYVLEVAGATVSDYTSHYFDTPELDAYYRMALRRRRRYKVRTRRYESTGQEFLEVKWKDGRKQTHKMRREHNGEIPLSSDAQDFVGQCLGEGGIYDVDVAALAPVLTTRYSRTTVLLPGDEARATIDFALECVTHDGRTQLQRVAIVETKAGAQLTELDRRLRQMSARQVKISKYGIGMAAVNAGLAQNKWSRLLRELTANHQLRTFTAAQAA